MSSIHAKFVGSIPETYESKLGPLLFDFYAEDLANRLTIGTSGRVLETACGTGISTEYLRRALAPGIEIVATDLNEPMLEIARAKRGDLPNVTFEEADALALPYDDASFDGVVCQFGVMFFPDKDAGMREAARVLKPGGKFLFNVWGSLDANPVARVSYETVKGFFEDDPPTFLTVPFGSYDSRPWKSALQAAGFSDLTIDVVRTVRERPSAREVAEGFVGGNPTIIEIEERATASSKEVIDAVAAAIAAEFGDNPMRTPLEATVYAGVK